MTSIILQVVESMCELMLTMSESEELAAELASYPVIKLLQNAMSEFPCIEDIVQVLNDYFLVNNFYRSRVKAGFVFNL